MIIPAQITAKHGVNQEEVFKSGRGTRGLADAVYEFAAIANDHLMTSREMFKEGVPREAMPIFLTGVCRSRSFE